MESKYIVIVGGGLVGQTLAERLSSDGHDVTVIESDPAKVEHVSDTLDVAVIQGNGATAPMLRQAGVERASLVVASTNSDEANMVVGLLAIELFNVTHVVVRLREPGHEEGFAQIGRGNRAQHLTVNPDIASVERIASLLEVPGAVDVVSFFQGGLLVAGFRIRSDSDFAGMRVSDMKLLFAATPTLVVAIHRGDDWIVPGGDEEIRAKDLVYFAIARHELSDVLSLVGAAEESGRRVMIAGAGTIGLELARRLERDSHQRVVLLEEDAAVAQRAAEVLEDTMVIHGAATDQTLLEDEEIELVSTFVAVTDNHESNLVAGLLAKRLGATRAYVLVDNPALVALMAETGIDAIISPRSLTIGLTLRFVRGGGVRSGAALLEDRVEIVEVEADRATRLCSGPLMDVRLPRGVLVAAIRRGERLLVPHGTDRVEPGDRVVLITTTDLAPKVTEFLSAPA